MIESFRRRDPLAERVLNQVLLGVSTRGYEASLEPRPKDVVARGSSKSAASRALIGRTRAKLRAHLDRRRHRLYARPGPYQLRKLQQLTADQRNLPHREAAGVFRRWLDE